MGIYYKDGFYHSAFSGFVPEGAVEISEEKYIELLNGQAQGKQIIPNKQGEPVLVEIQPTGVHQLNLETLTWEISTENLTAYIHERKQALLNKLTSKTDQFKARYLVGYSQAEIDSFYRQEREARGELPLMLLTELFEGRDDLTDIEQLKAKVIEKADLFAIVMGATFARKQHFEIAIEQAKTLDELAKIEAEIEQWR